MGELLVLWDVDYTLLNAAGLGNRLYEAVFEDMFGRELTVIAPKAGRTDRAIILEDARAGRRGRAARRTWMTPAVAGAPGGGAGRLRLPSRSAPCPGAADAIETLRRRPGSVQSVLTGNIRPLAALKLGAAALGEHLDLDVGAYGDAHEARAELVTVARQAAQTAYGTDFGGRSTVLVGDTPLDVAAALATGARAVGVATGQFQTPRISPRRARTPCCPT